MGRHSKTDGMTREQLAKRCETYRRQLGGAEAALRRERQKVASLQALVDELVAMAREAGRDAALAASEGRADDFYELNSRGPW